MSKEKHVPKYHNPGGHTDEIHCSCGWKSDGYWDCVEGALDEWYDHATKAGVKDPREVWKKRTRSI